LVGRQQEHPAFKKIETIPTRNGAEDFNANCPAYFEKKTLLIIHQMPFQAKEIIFSN